MKRQTKGKTGRSTTNRNKAMRGVAACLIGVASCLAACTQREMYGGFRSFAESVWHKDSVARFEATVTDSLALYEVWIEVRNDNQYPYKNLWLFVDFELPTGEVRRDTIECILADDYGKWYGKGLSLYELTIPYEQGWRYERTGRYVYTIRQAMRDDRLRGISDVGLRIVPKQR